MLCRCVFGYIPLEHPYFGQMFQADHLTGDVMNTCGVATVLCSLAGVCSPLLLGVAYIPVADDSAARGGLEQLGGTAPHGACCFWGEALGLPSPTWVRNPQKATRWLRLRRLPVLLANEILQILFVCGFENANEVLKAARRLKYVFLAAVPPSFECGTL